ncbi:winged helix-turn-helix domain-containing protein [Reyranella sp. CPCC 100927]|uniref:winged helix-turn-helix domain-containing tetratricopeptide repeat protein n=1 Tax=Reyranella sp. CPCC 100927 TaxID=2599616 RepID=UPI0011B35E06|nr:winged helix-turn-helix domain-containing protein [Reyranella sp. CPCC 100927]TWT12647.1 CadC-family transcriptional regulator [Reyranella sp. CPCC 100927]
MLFSFDDFVLDTARRELRGPDGLVALEPQVFDLLAYLIHNRDRVVSKDDILAAVWQGRTVSDSTLATRINAARGAIGDSGEAQRLIKTLPRRGLRFVGIIREQAAPTSTPASTPTPDRPSIAVLPFANIGGDPEQDYFADGMVEEIITALSRLRWLSVIARNSSFAYKGQTIDSKQVGHALGARYVLEGSVRKAAQRVRISGRLIDAATGTHLWADRFDGTLADIFDLQDQVTSRVVGAIAPRLGKAEIERARRKPTENLDAYDYFLRGMAHLHRWTRADSDEALHHFRQAIVLDPNFAPAYGLAGRCYSQRKACGWEHDRQQETEEAERLAWLAAARGGDDPIALCTAGIVLAYVAGHLADGDALVDQALALDPNLAWAWVFGSWVKIWRGEADAALDRAARAQQLSPQDPEVLFFTQTATAYCHFLAGRYDTAAACARTAIRQWPDIRISLCVAAASCALAGHAGDARQLVAILRRLDPALRISDLADLFPFGRPDDRLLLAEGLRQAGLAA